MFLPSQLTIGSKGALAFTLPCYYTHLIFTPTRMHNQSSQLWTVIENGTIEDDWIRGSRSRTKSTK